MKTRRAVVLRGIAYESVELPRVCAMQIPRRFPPRRRVLRPTSIDASGERERRKKKGKEPTTRPSTAIPQLKLCVVDFLIQEFPPLA